MTTSVRIAPLVVIIVLALGACSDPVPLGSTPPNPGPSVSTGSASGAPSVSPEPSSPSSEPRGTNDLAKNPLQRSLSASPLTANVEYSTSLPIKDWLPQVIKPLRISVTAINKKKSQKIYLSRLTASVTAYDADGVVDGPRALVDSANISPGYYVTFPTEYGQTLLLPAVDKSALRLTIDITYEFVALVSEGTKAGSQRDFAKQTATDRISVPLAD